MKGDRRVADRRTEYIMSVPHERVMEMRLAEAKLAQVYHWLVYTLEYPLCMSTDDKPEWLDITKLAEQWVAFEKERNPMMKETVEDYEYVIYQETGWPMT